MTENELRTLVEKYKQNPDPLSKNTAIAGLGEFLYLNLKLFRLSYLTEDTRSDFIVTLYPRFAQIIDKFDSSKASFSTYIRTVVRLSYRTFIKTRYGYEAQQKVYETEETTRLMSMDNEWINTTEPGIQVNEDKTAYLIKKALQNPEKMSKKKKEIHGRKIFLLACKSGYSYSDASIKQLSAVSGYSYQFIRTKLDYIHSKTETKREKIRCTSEKLNSFYIRSQKCLYEMKYLDSDSARYYALEKEYRYCIRRWNDIRSACAHQRKDLSNRFLSSALGISRATIDNTLATGTAGRVM